MDLSTVPAAFTTLDAKLASALESECRNNEQQKNVPCLAKLEADMMSYYELRKACMPRQMVLCLMSLETIQMVGADRGSLLVITFANMKWLGVNNQHEWLVLWHDLLPSLKNKAAINDRMRMEVIEKCLKQTNRQRRALHYREFLGPPPPKSFDWLFNRTQGSMDKSRAQVVNKKQFGYHCQGQGCRFLYRCGPCS